MCKMNLEYRNALFQMVRLNLKMKKTRSRSKREQYKIRIAHFRSIALHYQLEQRRIADGNFEIRPLSDALRRDLVEVKINAAIKYLTRRGIQYPDPENTSLDGLENYASALEEIVLND